VADSEEIAGAEAVFSQPLPECRQLEKGKMKSAWGPSEGLEGSAA
jgi:hypothetical protein